MTKISALAFMEQQQQAGKKSKLEPFRDDILLLKSQGYTQQQILAFLKLNGVSVGMTTLNWFIRSRMNKGTSPLPETKPVQVAPEPVAMPEVQEKRTPPAASPPPIGNRGARSFDWQGNKPSREELLGKSENN